MKHITRTFFASALVMALSAVAYAQAGGGAGSMKAPNETGYGSPGVPGTDVGAATGVDAAQWTYDESFQKRQDQRSE